MAKRYELSDEAWTVVADLFTESHGRGRPRLSDRLMLNGVLWILCSGGAWRDMPDRFGPWSTVYQRFRGWRNQGTFGQMLKRLHLRLNEQGLINLQTWMIDSTAVRATRASSGAGKKGRPDEPADHALGRSRGGLTTKIHMLCDANGTPLRFLLSGGQASDISYAQPLLDGVSIPSSQRGRPRKRCNWLLAEKGYDAEALRPYCDQYRMQPVIPMRSIKRKPKPGLPRLFDRPKYRQRNIIERMFGWLKENRRIVTRFDKLAKAMPPWSLWLVPCGVCDISFRTEPSLCYRVTLRIKHARMIGHLRCRNRVYFEQISPEAWMTYRFEYEKGRGGFARVDIVSNPQGLHFAQKTYDPQPQLLNDVGDEELRRRFVREVQYQSSVNHPNVVQIVESFLWADPPAFIMPIAECTLKDEMAIDNTLGANLNTALFDILSGLEHLHRSGYVHRDLKPANVLKFTQGAQVSYAISDFGLMSASHSDSSTLTGTNANGGTTNYAAPELIGNFRRATLAADIYAFGAILHDIFGNAAQRIPYTELDGPGEIGSIIQRCTKRLPMRRYPNVSALREDLYQALHTRPVVFNSSSEERIVDLLRANATLNDGQWDEVFIQIERNLGRSQSTNIIFQALTIEHISALDGNAPELFSALGSYFADHINGHSFNFDYCDVLASKAEIFYNAGDITLKTNIALALLYLGTSHNRWYVERKAAAMLSSAIDNLLAERIRVEITVTNFPFSAQIKHMERSISFTRETLHPILRALV